MYQLCIKMELRPAMSLCLFCSVFRVTMNKLAVSVQILCVDPLSENGSWRFCVKRGWLPALRKHETQDAPDGKDAKKSDNGEDT